MAKIDIYKEITDQIIKSIEEGTPAWRKPWSGGTGCTFPTRANGEFYKGINVLVLWMAADKQKFDSNYWMTFKQASTLEGHVKKGEKSTRVIYYGTIEKEEDDKNPIPYIKTFAAFNASQIEGLPDQFYPAEIVTYDTQLDPVIMEKFNTFDIEIKLSEAKQAAYNPVGDFIEMPPVENFGTQEGYFATLAHEIAHATGHKSRLGRDDKQTPYAFEELIAEIGSCMVCARLGLVPDFGQSGAYVEHWLNVLKQDKKAIFRAASQAQKACDYIMERITPEEIEAVA